MTAAPVFYFDYSSPYAYLASARIGDLLPRATWRPIVFGALLREIGKVSWSLRPGREAGMREIEERAAARGLPPVRWPGGWPDRSYSVLPLRAALVADAHGVLARYTAAAYRIMFAEGHPLDALETVLEAAAAAGLDRAAVSAGVEDAAIGARLRGYTAEAIARGVTGVPTVAVGGALFWGDDLLEDAATAAA